MQQTQAGHHIDKQEHASILAVLAILIGAAMALTILIGMAGGKVHGWKPQIALLILTAVPVCSVGTALAITSLVWRKENKNIAQAALWLNGMLAFFAFPIMVYWLLAM